jgi:hypothetical protein
MNEEKDEFHCSIIMDKFYYLMQEEIEENKLDYIFIELCFDASRAVSE